jgi:L-ascorbate metabolism protein UlaG (beta-lactamase superfamily)
MQLTKYTHSCVRITDDSDRRLVIDPGVFSEVEEALEGIDAVLITHQHPDHIDTGKLVAAAQANPDLKIWGPADLLGELAKLEALADRLTVVGPGQSFTAGGLQVRTFGGQHALIHSSIPVVSNVAYLVADAVYHPGDSFTVPTAGVEALLVPIHAPWSKVSEVIDFTVSVRAPRAFPLHDSLLTDIGRNMVEGHVTRIGAEHGSTFEHLNAGQVVEL